MCLQEPLRSNFFSWRGNLVASNNGVKDCLFKDFATLQHESVTYISYKDNSIIASVRGV